MTVKLFISSLALLLTATLALKPFQKFGQFRFNSEHSTTTTQLNSVKSDRPFLGSKLLADVTPDEMAELLKEFNITNFDMNKDPELLKWEVSKTFFEKYGFKDNTERYSRTTMNVKMDFYSAYTKPILPQYKSFISDLMTVTNIQSVDVRFQYDALYAFGLCTQYYTIMKGYPLQDEIDPIFNAYIKSILLDPIRVRDDAKRILTEIKALNATGISALDAKEGELADIINSVRVNRFFKYTDAWGIGLGRMMELNGIDPNRDNLKLWATSLKWVFIQRLGATWDEFNGDQVKMQGVESMQKQLLIREKKRAATRLEKKAAEFSDKKKALQELNAAVEERRLIMIEEKKKIKQRFEPEEYAKLMLEVENAKAVDAIIEPKSV